MYCHGQNPATGVIPLVELTFWTEKMLVMPYREFAPIWVETVNEKNITSHRQISLYLSENRENWYRKRSI